MLLQRPFIIIQHNNYLSKLRFASRFEWRLLLVKAFVQTLETVHSSRWFLLRNFQTGIVTQPHSQPPRSTSAGNEHAASSAQLRRELVDGVRQIAVCFQQFEPRGPDSASQSQRSALSSIRRGKIFQCKNRTWSAKLDSPRPRELVRTSRNRFHPDPSCWIQRCFTFLFFAGTDESLFGSFRKCRTCLWSASARQRTDCKPPSLPNQLGDESRTERVDKNWPHLSGLNHLCKLKKLLHFSNENNLALL